MNKVIIYDNKTAQIVLDDEDLLKVLRLNLSYKENGVEFTPAYKNGWDGRTYLVNKKGYFFSGLVNRVIEFLKDHKLDFVLEDSREQLEINESLDLTPALNKINIVPRDYQERIVNLCASSRKGIVRACTGSGKSLAIALLLAKLNKPTIVYVIGLDLLKQFHDLLSKLFDEPIGFIGDGVCNIQRINVATIWSIGRALNVNKKAICLDDEESCEEKFNVNQKDKILDLLEKTKVHILDECHVVTCKTISEIHKKINPEYIYGFSGTPYRDDGTDLLANAILGEQIVDVSASELIEKGVLARPIIKFIPIPHMSLPLAQYQTVYKTYVVENIVRNMIIVNQVKELVEKKYPTLVLFKQIKHGQIIFDMLKEAGIRCDMLYGNDSLKKRAQVKEDLEQDRIDVMICSVIADIGFDFPKLSGLVLCGSGKSKIRALQRIGRIVRSYRNKRFAAVVDFYDQVKFLKKHSLIRYETYASESGFKIIKCKEMKK